MIILITGASHTGKTLLAQRMLVKYKYPYISIDHIKMGCSELRKKPYVGYRSYDVVMNSFYMVCQILKVRDHITPPFSDEELRLIMYHPLTIGDIFHSHRRLMGNLMLWSVCRLPLWLFMPTIKVMGKLKRVL